MSLAHTPLDTTPYDREHISYDLLVAELPKEYELLDEVSEGGMGVVYKARNRQTNAHVAIKVISPDIAQKRKAVQRFLVEAKAASSLKHPNICKVHDFGATASGLSYLVMEWIDGICLGRKIIRDKRASVSEAVRIFQQIAAAIAHAHEHKVIHRDLKPENIMLTRDAEGRTEVRVVDFGIAKVLADEENVTRNYSLTSAGMVVGTPMFMSPEQARSTRVDGRSDIYSLGCVMYFTLTGNPPFRGETGVDTIAMHINEPVPEIDPTLDVPGDLKRIVMRAMEKSPDDRYQTMEELALDLKKLTKGVGLTHRLLSGERRAARKRVVIVLCFVFGFALTYALSLALQNYLDTSNKHSTSNGSTQHQVENAGE
jgi:serine/threonine-protein kinase